MTTTELRELDAWIAENVMDWLKVNKTRQLDHAGRFCVDAFGNVTIHAPLHKSRDGFVYFIPTTDPAAAMDVLRRCVIEVSYRGDDVIFRKKRLFSFQQEYTEVRAKAETLELAICLFAKKLFEK